MHKSSRILANLQILLGGIFMKCPYICHEILEKLQSTVSFLPTILIWWVCQIKYVRKSLVTSSILAKLLLTIQSLQNMKSVLCNAFDQLHLPTDAYTKGYCMDNDTSFPLTQSGKNSGLLGCIIIGIIIWVPSEYQCLGSAHFISDRQLTSAINSFEKPGERILSVYKC